MITVKILDKEYELFVSTHAYEQIGEMCGGIRHLAEWLKGDDRTEQLSRVLDIMLIELNAAIIRDNYKRKLGELDGTDKPLFDRDMLAAVISMSDLAVMAKSVLSAFAEGQNYEIPEGVKVTKKDVDSTLAEIYEKREKNAGSGE